MTINYTPLSMSFQNTLYKVRLNVFENRLNIFSGTLNPFFEDFGNFLSTSPSFDDNNFLSSENNKIIFEKF